MAAGEAITAGQSLGSGSPVASAPAVPEEWRSGLERAGAVLDGDRVIAFGEPERERDRALSGEVMADLSQLGLIAVEGPDASTFLASLFTGDVRLISPAQGQFTSWCDAKGRMLATFWLFMRGEAYYLLLPMALLPSTLIRLRQFKLRSKVNIGDASGQLARIGLSGPALSASLADALGGEPPSALGETKAFGDLVVMALRATPVPRWLAIGPAESVQSLWDKLQPTAQAVGEGVWSLLDILAGIPLLVSETSGEFVPQMLNLEALGGLCFTKGCYPGQEVVARLHYRGQLKRRLYLASVDSDQIPEPGAKLYTQGTGESVGMVVSAAFSGKRKVALLAVVVIEYQQQGDIRLGGLLGPRLEFQEQAADGAADQ